MTSEKDKKCYLDILNYSLLLKFKSMNIGSEKAIHKYLIWYEYGIKSINCNPIKLLFEIIFWIRIYLMFTKILRNINNLMKIY